MSDRLPWDFEYAPIPIGGGDVGEAERDVVLATEEDVDPAEIVQALAGSVTNIAVTPVFSGYPVFWTRLQSSDALDREDIHSKIEALGVRVRYIVSATKGSQMLPSPLDFRKARPRRPVSWQATVTRDAPEEDTPWRWFMRNEGVGVNRVLCGTGAGTRLAIIDNDGRDLDKVDLDAEILVGVSAVPRAAAHAALLIGWCVGAKTTGETVFRGVAPDASPRLYCIPKRSDDVLSLPLAIVQAVDDGADVVVCATSVEGQTSPLLDDALDFATRLGRGGRGTAVVMPTGREMSSAPGSLHSSLSLGLADPGGDPRVFCVGPSSRVADWFLWRDRNGKLRPFANRGPSVRWLAPGDDMAHPFAGYDRPAHAESSGASAIAAGVILLVLERNPDLELSELDAVLTTTVTRIDPRGRGGEPEIADAANLLPQGVDADGHNSKHGYGCLNATAACVSISDPIAAALVRIGASEAACNFALSRRSGEVARLYSQTLGRWAARVLLRDASLQHALCAILRSARLASRYPERFLQQPPGHLFRQFGTVLGMFARANPPVEVASELKTMADGIRGMLREARAVADADRLVLELLSRIFHVRNGTTSRARGTVAAARLQDLPS
jgi:hypothetical protein